MQCRMRIATGPEPIAGTSNALDLQLTTAWKMKAASMQLALVVTIVALKSAQLQPLSTLIARQSILAKFLN
jgi:hypothetical protein